MTVHLVDFVGKHVIIRREIKNKEKNGTNKHLPSPKNFIP